MIKTADKTATEIPLRYASYEESTTPCMGVTFCRKDGAQRFASYAFLASVDFDGRGEMIFRFTAWTATVRGESLQALWKALREGCLVLVRETDRSHPAEGSWVCEVTFSEPDSDVEISVRRPF
jgi:hypothetical protein